MAPFDISTLGSIPYALLFGAIGFGFGAALEMTGFGDTRKLAAQFYLRDLTVLKTMFTAIVVAALLLFLASGAGALDMSRVFVNPTYLWPGIVGGLIMGVGFVIGGFCPGTSLVAAATLKVDGILFVAGGLTGVWLFGESVSSFETFWISSSYGRFTLPEWLGLSVGATVLLVALMAVLMFWGAGQLERRFAPSAIAVPSPVRRFLRLVGAGTLIAAAVLVAVIGQPSPDQRWNRSPKLQELVRSRAIFVDPAEVAALRKDIGVEVQVIDLRSEHDFNLFHVGEARRADPETLETPEALKALRDRPTASVAFLVSNGEEVALGAWKRLQALGVPNLYVIEGGMNHWLERYPVPTCVGTRIAAAAEEPRWQFAYATGASLPSAWPELETSRGFKVPCEEPISHAAAEHGARWPTVAFTKRVKLQSKAAVKGGCG
jgi:rhodanese-related sulfurtransferase